VKGGKNMKKIWVLLLLLPFTKVNAITTHYSDYRDYKLGTEEVLDLDDTLKREEYKVYNTEVTNIEDQGYVSEDICSIKYPNDTKTTYTIRPASSYNHKWYTSVALPEGNITKVIVYITNYINVKEMVVYEKGKKVNAYLSPTDDTLNKIMDNDLDTYMRLPPNMNIQIIFPKMSSKDFSIEFIASDKLKGQLIIYYEDGTNQYRTIDADIVDVVSQDFLDDIKPVVGVFTGNGQVASYEKVPKTLYHCYKRDSYISNEYKRIPSSENETLILEDYKTLYDYYIRDKVKISDKKITSSKTSLKELITFSTINLDNLRIEGNVDYTKNGTYHVKYIFNDDFIVDKDVVINIAKNDKVVEPTTTKSTITTTTTTNITKPTTTKSTSTTTTTNTTKTTINTNTSTSVPTTTTNNISTTKITSTTNRTTRTIRPNDTCPTYNTYKDEEVLEVEPLKGNIKEPEKENNNKHIFKILMLLIVIILIIIYIIIRIREIKKETC